MDHAFESHYGRRRWNLWTSGWRRKQIVRHRKELGKMRDMAVLCRIWVYELVGLTVVCVDISIWNSDLDTDNEKM